MHTLYSFSGSGESVSYLLTSALLFILPSLIIPILFLIFKHPLIAFGGVIPILPWLLLAYYVDHIMPYEGGGASIMYVAVLFGVSIFISRYGNNGSYVKISLAFNQGNLNVRLGSLVDDCEIVIYVEN